MLNRTIYIQLCIFVS